MTDALQGFVGRAYGRESWGPDPVNQPMIRHLVEALDDRNPIYVDDDAAKAAGFPGVVAPATSLQVWTMQGLRRHAPAADSQDHQSDLMSLLDREGYVGVVATNCEQTYMRYLRPGDHLKVTSTLESISELKKTGLGEGYFITTQQTYRDQHDEVVGEMLFRILKYVPGTGKERAPATGDGTASAPDEVLPPLDIVLTPTVIVATAIATRDYQDVHHDKDRAIELGSENIFMNILTSTGFVGRYITDWGGPTTRLKRVAIRLGAPNYPYDTMHMAGKRRGTTISVRGSNSRGDHLIGTVEVAP